MKKILYGLIIFIVFLTTILVYRTLTYQNSGFNPNSTELEELPELSLRSIQRFQGGLRIATVSNENYSLTDFRPFIEMQRYLSKAFPLFHSRTDKKQINNYSLVYRWKGKDEKKLPLLFLAHLDVVPVAELSGWEVPPFSGQLVNNRIYGRGTLDMKNVLFGLLEASESLILEDFVPERDVYFAFGHDEEVGGREGAGKIAEYFNSLGLKFEAVYDEGGIIAKSGTLSGINRDIALIGVAEKGFLSIKIIVKGLGGHSSMPPLQTSMGRAAEIMLNLEKNQMDSKVIPIVDNFLDGIGREMDFPKRLLFANQWLFRTLLLNQLSKIPAMNALTRTTTALTMMKGSEQSNILPQEAEIVINFRLLPGDTVQDVLAHIQKAVKGFDVELIEISNTREASKISSTNTKSFHHLNDSISKVFPSANILPYITIAGTDATKYEILSQNIYRFNPVVLDSVEQRSIHNHNEYISVDNYRRTIQFYKLMIQNYDRLTHTID